MARALIDVDGVRIAQIVPDGEDFPVAPPLKWVQVPNGTTTRHRYVGGVAVPPDPPPVVDPSTFPLTADELAALLIAKGAITQQEVDDIKSART